MPHTDAELVRLARAGSTPAFAELYERYRDPVTRYAARITRDHALAEDVVQDAFVSALRKLAALRDPDRFRPWLFSIVHRGAVDVVRADGPLLLADPPEPAPEPERDDTATELVRDAVAALEPRQRAILELTLREGLRTAELARALGLSTAHAAVLAHRARTALGRAVRILLVVRARRECARLDALVPDGTHRLTAAQRSSVDRHLRRCAACGAHLGRVTVPLAVAAAMIYAAGRSAPPAAARTAGRIAVAGVGGAAVMLLWWGLPDAPVPVPPPVALPTTAATTPPTTPAPPAAPLAPVTTTTTTPPSSPAPPPTEEQRLIALVDARRDCGPLRVDPKLTEVARAHSKHMASTGEIDMTGPDGVEVSDRVRDEGYRGGVAVALGASTETARQTVDSLGELAGFSCEYRSVGVSRVVGGPPCHWYWTIVFGRT